MKPNNQGGPYIFVSYSHLIKEKAYEIINILMKNGYRAWFDAGLTAGSSYNKTIARHIAGCEVFCCLLSEGYDKSSYCRKEFMFASEELKKPILPVYVGCMDEIKAALPIEMRLWLSDVHSIEFSNEEEFIEQINASEDTPPCRITGSQYGFAKEDEALQGGNHAEEDPGFRLETIPEVGNIYELLRIHLPIR